MNLTEFIASERSDHPHYMVIGNPISHSYSPLMHNYAIKYHRLDAEYHPIQLLETEIAQCVSHFRRDSFLGANITIPYKEWFLSIIDELTVEAESIGAVNTILKKDNKIIGHNTDAYGFIAPIRMHLNLIAGERCIVFGSGGATKAIIYALRAEGAEEIVIVSRNPEAHEDHSNGKVNFISYDIWEEYASESSMLINATPLGMYPNVNSSPVEVSKCHLMAGKLCYDIVYNPFETRFLEQAKENEGIPIGGLDMLIYQGEKAFELWTGKAFPVDKVRKELMRVI